MKRVSLVVTLALAAGLSAQAASAQTLKTVKDRGMLSCGVGQGLPGFSSPDDKGNWTGLDVDVCRAIAAAVFNDATKIKFVPLSAKDRFTALQSGEIDVLSRNTTWTLSRDTSLGANFTGVTYYDGQGFLVKKSLKVNSALELNSASVCVQTGTTTEQNLADYFKGNNMKYEVIAFGTATKPSRPTSPAAATSSPPTSPSSMPSASSSPTRPITSCCLKSSRRSRSDRWSAMATISGSTS
jgi:general L-amino acid transport system substrate-binding protein